jgi:hypothetical protein
VNGALVGTERECLLDSAVLIPKRDFEMKHQLAHAGESEVPRLDDTRMDRSHGHFMNVGAGYFKEIGDAYRSSSEPNWFEPGMAQRADSPQLRYFPFKPVRLRTTGRERWISFTDFCRKNPESALIVSRCHGKETVSVISRLRKQRHQPVSMPDDINNFVGEVRDRRYRDIAHSYALVITTRQ